MCLSKIGTKEEQTMNPIDDLINPKKDRKRSPGSIVNDLIYLDKDFIAKMELFFYEKMKMIEAKEKNPGLISVNGETEFYFDYSKNKPVTISEVNKRLINTVEKYRQQKNDLIDEFLETGAVFTGGADYEYCIYRSN